MSIRELIPQPGIYELVQSKVLDTLRADSVLAAVVRSFSCELPDENRAFAAHEAPRLLVITEGRDQDVDQEGQARIDRFQVSITSSHLGLKLADLVLDAQRLAAYVELMLEEQGRLNGGLSGLAEAVEGAAGSLALGPLSTEFYTNRSERGNLYEVDSVTSLEIELTRPLAGE